MKDIARMALQHGMEIGADVYNYQNELVISAGTIVNPAAINKLVRHSIMCVPIKEAIDYAVTHFEKITLSHGFKSFHEAYNIAMLSYKTIMMEFVEAHIPFQMEQIMQIYTTLIAAIDNHDKLLDYLYNMLPSEDNLTYAHCLNSALIAGVFSSWLCLSQEETEILIQCAFCYDLGKLKLPYDLIWKPGKLTDIEYETIKTHTLLGFHMLKDMPLNSHVLKSTLMHHERCDGSGYPSKLLGHQIDIYSKYIAIIDAYEAMTSARIYRQSKHPFHIITIFSNDSHKYGIDVLRPILFRIANRMIGLNVLLNDDTVAEVVIINQSCIGRPLLRAKDGTLIDLYSRKDLEIKGIY